MEIEERTVVLLSHGEVVEWYAFGVILQMTVIEVIWSSYAMQSSSSNILYRCMPSPYDDRKPALAVRPWYNPYDVPGTSHIVIWSV